MTVIVDLPAVRPARLAARLGADDIREHVRALHDLVRGARAEALPRGVRLVLERDVAAVARLADVVRAEADGFPFWSFRLLADPPACWLEVTGTGRAGELARTVFGGLAE